MVRYPLYSPDIAPAHLFLHWRIKSELADVWLSQESSKTSWNGVVRNVAKNWPLQKVHLNRQGLGLKKAQNICVFKMINMKSISPCAFVSDLTLVDLCLRHIKSLSILNCSVQQKLRWTKFNTKSLGVVLRPWRWTLNFYYSEGWRVASPYVVDEAGSQYEIPLLGADQ